MTLLALNVLLAVWSAVFISMIVYLIFEPPVPDHFAFPAFVFKLWLTLGTAIVFFVFFEFGLAFVWDLYSRENSLQRRDLSGSLLFALDVAYKVFTVFSYFIATYTIVRYYVLPTVELVRRLKYGKQVTTVVASTHRQWYTGNTNSVQPAPQDSTSSGQTRDGNH